MKVEAKEYNNEIFGIDLIPENEIEQNILKRFWNGGVFTQGFSTSGKLSLTFKDLIAVLKYNNFISGFYVGLIIMSIVATIIAISK